MKKGEIPERRLGTTGHRCDYCLQHRDGVKWCDIRWGHKPGQWYLGYVMCALCRKCTYGNWRYSDSKVSTR